MESENLNMTEITEARRKTIAETIRPISVEELQKLSGDLFPYADHPWRESFEQFIRENSGATYYHATTHDQIHILYCPSKDKGIWYLPGSGLGPLQAKGLKIMKQVVEKVH
jgi:CRISPR/Cas system endoribonuclease Cas6 (RAMP superfamily)